MPENKFDLRGHVFTLADQIRYTVAKLNELIEACYPEGIKTRLEIDGQCLQADKGEIEVSFVQTIDKTKDEVTNTVDKLNRLLDQMYLTGTKTTLAVGLKTIKANKGEIEVKQTMSVDV